jgi:hypothetical protein
LVHICNAENLATLDNAFLISTPDDFSQVPVSNGELSGQATDDLPADGEPSIADSLSLSNFSLATCRCSCSSCSRASDSSICENWTEKGKHMYQR